MGVLGISKCLIKLVSSAIKLLKIRFETIELVLKVTFNSNKNLFESSEIFLVFVLLLSASVKLLQPDHFRSEVFFKFNEFQLRINAYVVIFFQIKFYSVYELIYRVHMVVYQVFKLLRLEALSIYSNHRLFTRNKTTV